MALEVSIALALGVLVATMPMAAIPAVPHKKSRLDAVVCFEAANPSAMDVKANTIRASISAAVTEDAIHWFSIIVNDVDGYLAPMDG
jgi:hypothetical protein